jgi:ABC-2 type transport system permease protein
LLLLDLPVSGSLLYGASLALLGLSFTAVGAATAQVTAHARGALGIAAAVLGVSYILRAAGDVGESAWRWFSPLGWAQAAQPYGDERWWPSLLALGFVVLVLGLAVELTTHRDVGAGLVPPRAGPANASPRLTSALGLALRLQRGTLIGWTAGMLVGGVAFGSFGREVSAMVEDNPELADAFAQAGTANVVDAYFATVLTVLAIIGAGFTISSVLRARAEESAGRAEPLLATGLSRTRWVLGNLTVTLVGTLLVVGAAGFGAGLVHGLISDDMGELPRLFGVTMAYTPAILVLGGLGVLLFGWVPKAAVATWAALAGCFVVSWLGALLDFPGWAQDLSPFTHVGQVPVETVAAAPLAALTAIALAAAGVGILGLRRRDIG